MFFYPRPLFTCAINAAVNLQENNVKHCLPGQSFPLRSVASELSPLTAPRLSPPTNQIRRRDRVGDASAVRCASPMQERRISNKIRKQNNSAILLQCQQVGFLMFASAVFMAMTTSSPENAGIP